MTYSEFDLSFSKHPITKLLPLCCYVVKKIRQTHQIVLTFKTSNTLLTGLSMRDLSIKEI